MCFLPLLVSLIEHTRTPTLAGDNLLLKGAVAIIIRTEPQLANR